MYHAIASRSYRHWIGAFYQDAASAGHSRPGDYAREATAPFGPFFYTAESSGVTCCDEFEIVLRCARQYSHQPHKQQSPAVVYLS